MIILTKNTNIRPRLSVIDKSSTSGFGFNLLYLEDRKGEFVEDIFHGGPAFQAGMVYPE